MKKYNLILFLFCGLAYFKGYTQVKFKTVYGVKASYSISIPTNYLKVEAIGGNVDMKYRNSVGATIGTVIRILPKDFSDSDINQLNNSQDFEFKEGLEANGLTNISVLKKGMIVINGIESFYLYYSDYNNYYHSVTQYRKGKLINLTFTCLLGEKLSYMPYIYRVINSLK